MKLCNGNCCNENRWTVGADGEGFLKEEESRLHLEGLIRVSQGKKEGKKKGRICSSYKGLAERKLVGRYGEM